MRGYTIPELIENRDKFMYSMSKSWLCFLIFKQLGVLNKCLVIIRNFQTLTKGSFNSIVCVSHLVVSDSATPRNVAHQAPLSLEYSRQEQEWLAIFLLQGNLPNPWTKPRSPALQANALPSKLLGKLFHSIMTNELDNK